MKGMEVNPNAGTSPLQGVTTKLPVVPPAKPQAGDSASFQGTDAVNSALQQTPDVRPEAVSRARALITDAQYPPQSMIHDISRLLAANLKQNES
jgi:hypothetical protein